MEEQKWYGFDFYAINSGGIGAGIYALMLAHHYAISNKLQFGIVAKRGWPLLNGVRKPGEEQMLEQQGEWKTWHDYFTSLPLVEKEKIIGSWNACPASPWTRDPPSFPSSSLVKVVNPSRIEWFGKIIRDLYQLQPSIAAEVEKELEDAGFRSTDVVLHIRRTDKIQQVVGSRVESGELPLQLFFEETLKEIGKLNLEEKEDKPRVFLCTCDRAICEEMKKMFQKEGIEMVYDPRESTLHLQSMRMSGQLTKEMAHQENITALKNIMIMARARLLIGGRYSYIFRTAELLRYPLPSVNLKDSDVFGKAEYAEEQEEIIRPISLRAYSNFFSEKYQGDLSVYTTQLEKEYLIVLPDVMNEILLPEIIDKAGKFPDNWWTHAIRPDEKGQLLLCSGNDPKLMSAVLNANQEADQGRFAYYFKRTTGKHYDTCNCIWCKLAETFRSYPMLEFLSRVVGKPVRKMNETFLSCYERNNFLTMHHDKAKGDYAFVLALSQDWNPAHGGLTHFWDYDTKTIYKTISPVFNNLTIFRLDPNHQMNHFVSRVVGPHKRLAYTGWFSL